MSTQPTLDSVLEDCWSALEQGASSARNPFHLGVLGTMDRRGPKLRTVVLRNVDRTDRTLSCHTDARSSKLDQIASKAEVSWLFYDAATRVQLRVEGTARIHRSDRVARSRWDNSPARARRCYAVTPAPGTAVNGPTSGLPPYLAERSPTHEESGEWAHRFAVVVTRIERLEWLHLAARGHRRARFDWPEGQPVATWLIP